MRNKILFALAAIGIIAGLIAAYIFSAQKNPLPPAFPPAANPYEKGIYANGIIESAQESGENVNVYPEVAGVVTKIVAHEGQYVRLGAPILILNDAVQRANTAQLKAQTISSRAQIVLAEANLKTLQDTYDKNKNSYDLDPRSVSQDTLDTMHNATAVAAANVTVSRAQYDASVKAFEAAEALLRKYEIVAPADGTVLSINTAVGSYISPQGVYNTYTEGFSPAMVIGNTQQYLAVRCYIDEILINRLPKPENMKARMSIKGTTVEVPLEYVRSQPYVAPKIELSNQRNERVDVRVLPLIFRFAKPDKVALYPGQLVDVYIGEK